jgi:hypothetical protein
MKTNNKLAAVLILGAFGIVGCSAKVSGGSAPNDIPQLPGFGNPGATTQPVQAAATPLDGRWKLACSALNGQLHADGELDFSGNTYSSIMNVYVDAQCTVSMGSAQEQFGFFTLPATGQINFTQANGEADYDVYEIDSKVLYMGIQAATDANSRPQAVDRALGYTYAGAAEIVNN